MSSFTENLYLKRQIQKLQEENYQLKYTLQEAGIEGLLRPFFGGGSAVQSAAKALSKKRNRVPSTNQPPGPGSFGHGYSHPKPFNPLTFPLDVLDNLPLTPGQVLPTNIPPQTPGMGTFGQSY